MRRAVRLLAGLAVAVILATPALRGRAQSTDQSPAIPTAPPPPEDPILPAMDSNQVGYEGIAVDGKVVSLPLLDAQIAMWQQFLDWAPREAAARETRAGHDDLVKAALLRRDIASAQSHLQALQAAKKIRDQDPGECGLDQLHAAWDDLKKFVGEQRARLEPVAAMKTPPLPTSIFGEAGTLVAGIHHAIMQDALQNDEELRRVAEFNIRVIERACKEAKAQKSFDDYVHNVDEANKVAEQRAKEAETIAEGGKFDDVQVIAEGLITTLTVGRANQLLGKELGLQQQQAALHVLHTFAVNAAKSCKSQSFKPVIALEVQRSLQLAENDDIDFGDCLSRLWESAGSARMFPYVFRHCGPDPSGTWSMLITAGNATLKGEVVVGGTGAGLKGETVVGRFGAASVTQNPLGMLGFTRTYAETDAAAIEATGTLRPSLSKPTRARVSGTIKLSAESLIHQPGVVVHVNLKMHTQLTVDGFPATPAQGGLTTFYPAMAVPEWDQPITIGNGNRPCDPKADVWSYPPG